jgi:hypothetical protein
MPDTFRTRFFSLLRVEDQLPGSSFQHSRDDAERAGECA